MKRKESETTQMKINWDQIPTKYLPVFFKKGDVCPELSTAMALEPDVCAIFNMAMQAGYDHNEAGRQWDLRKIPMTRWVIDDLLRLVVYNDIGKCQDRVFSIELLRKAWNQLSWNVADWFEKFFQMTSLEQDTILTRCPWRPQEEMIEGWECQYRKAMTWADLCAVPGTKSWKQMQMKPYLCYEMAKYAVKKTDNGLQLRFLTKDSILEREVRQDKQITIDNLIRLLHTNMSLQVIPVEPISNRQLATKVKREGVTMSFKGDLVYISYRGEVIAVTTRWIAEVLYESYSGLRMWVDEALDDYWVRRAREDIELWKKDGKKLEIREQKHDYFFFTGVNCHLYWEDTKLCSLGQSWQNCGPIYKNQIYAAWYGQPINSDHYISFILSVRATQYADIAQMLENWWDIIHSLSKNRVGTLMNVLPETQSMDRPHHTVEERDEKLRSYLKKRNLKFPYRIGTMDVIVLYQRGNAGMQKTWIETGGLVPKNSNVYVLLKGEEGIASFRFDAVVPTLLRQSSLPNIAVLKVTGENAAKVRTIKKVWIEGYSVYVFKLNQKSLTWMFVWNMGKFALVPFFTTGSFITLESVQSECYSFRQVESMGRKRKSTITISPPIMVNCHSCTIGIDEMGKEMKRLYECF